MNRNDLHIYKALAASQLVFNCGSLREAREKLTKIMGPNFILYEGGHHLAILLRQVERQKESHWLSCILLKIKGPISGEPCKNYLNWQLFSSLHRSGRGLNTNNSLADYSGPRFPDSELRW